MQTCGICPQDGMTRSLPRRSLLPQLLLGYAGNALSLYGPWAKTWPSLPTWRTWEGVSSPENLLSMFSRQEYWSGLPFPSPGDLPDPGIKPASPALAGGFFTMSHQGSRVTTQCHTSSTTVRVGAGGRLWRNGSRRARPPEGHLWADKLTGP